MTELTVNDVKVMHMPPKPFIARAKKMRMERSDTREEREVRGDRQAANSGLLSTLTLLMVSSHRVASCCYVITQPRSEGEEPKEMMYVNVLHCRDTYWSGHWLHRR
jgi:hypothetical protein